MACNNKDGGYTTKTLIMLASNYQRAILICNTYICPATVPRRCPIGEYSLQGRFKGIIDIICKGRGHG